MLKSLKAFLRYKRFSFLRHMKLHTLLVRSQIFIKSIVEISTNVIKVVSCFNLSKIIVKVDLHLALSHN